MITTLHLNASPQEGRAVGTLFIGYGLKEGNPLGTLPKGIPHFKPCATKILGGGSGQKWLGRP